MQQQLGLKKDRIHKGDCIKLMQKIKAGSVDLVFADPPFNIGYEYDQYDDRQESDKYLAWSDDWIAAVHRVLKSSGTFWLAIGDKYAAELKVAAKQIGFATRSWVVWYYTFGVNCTKKFSRSHTHLFHFVKDEGDFTFNAEDPAVRVPSARAMVYGDKRANPKGRLPDDTWILRPQDLPDGFQPTEDTWYYARVAGTFKERQGFHGCQMPEQLLGRIVRASSNPGELVLDPFSGSGTTLAVAKKLGRQWIGCELSAEYVRSAMRRINAVHEGDSLNGPADSISSAPTTSKGRRLANAQSVQNERSLPIAQKSVRQHISDAIVEAFLATHDGYSSDWVLANPEMQSGFHNVCRDLGLIGGPADWNHQLIGLRKSSRLPKTNHTKRIRINAVEMDSYSFAAEIAWRQTQDEFANASLDEILCDPDKAAFFDHAASKFAPGFTPAQYRWAALHLRKANSKLLKKVKEFHSEFESCSFNKRTSKLSAFDYDEYRGVSGLYLLQTNRKEPIFADRAFDLGIRLKQHADCEAITERFGYLALISPRRVPDNKHQELKVDLVQRYRPQLNLNYLQLTQRTAI